MSLSLAEFIGLADSSQSLIGRLVPSRYYCNRGKYLGVYQTHDGYELNLVNISYQGQFKFEGTFPSQKINGQSPGGPVPLVIHGMLNGDVFEGHYIFKEKTWSTSTYDFGVIYGRYYRNSFFLAFENRSYESRWKGIGAEYIKKD